MKNRETFGSRLGFILISAGCAIGLGNVWRFPYVAGEYGGAAFILIYLLFLVILGLPIMTMEFSVGRASRQSVAKSFRELEPKGGKWHWFSFVGVAGNYLLMMFYTTVTAWMFLYLFKMARGDFLNTDAASVSFQFDQMLARPALLTALVAVVTVIGFGVCSLGLRGGVEKITKVMMILLIAIMAVLAVRSVTLPDSGAGLRYYLIPDFHRMAQKGLGNVIFAAMGQAFFTLSIGMGSMSIFGSYLGKERRLLGESVHITLLDTAIAVIAGLIVIPACFAYHVDPGSGPRLIFITLPNIFHAMPLGRLWGTLFFLFLIFAALSTVIAVFENIVSFGMDLWGWSRKKACFVNVFAVLLLSLPCVLGFNVLSSWQPLGTGSNIMDLEDFLVSNNILPLGSLVYLLFCTCSFGWGWEPFLKEANRGRGLRFPKGIRLYCKYAVPVIVLFILVQGYISRFVC